ncbi:hypothetical protein GDO81_004117 [Engystomops pustulosus]|uniref:Alpha-2-macroglobulin n=1 Tax=Engystomops pustulosus TaxID=76066 RepID=A0AAV6ZXR8_ENGPU|nr:hypothetical protein GDO81_004117 [Engystomops pustulosus]
MSWTWTCCVGLILLQIFGGFKAELHYAAIIPSELRAHHHETLCLQLEEAKGESKVKISLHLNNKDTTLIDKSFQQESIFSCIEFEVPIPGENEEVGTVTVFIENSGESVTNTSKVLVKKPYSRILVQTDKAVYKPGQTVKFRILSLNEDFKPENTLDPDKNRISQWLSVNLDQGMADLSFDLSSEPTFGEYSIKLKEAFHTFSVEEYVLPKFEVNIQFPKQVLFNCDQFPVEVCAKYTYGKPVQGDFTAAICREANKYYWGVKPKEPTICANFSGKVRSLSPKTILDRSGCHTIEIKSVFFRLNESLLTNELKGSASVIEEGTGVELSSTGHTTITNVINKVSFINADSNYKSGIPYSGLIKVEDAKGAPKPNTKVYLKCGTNSVCETLVTDENGKAPFTLNTTDWKGYVILRAQINLIEEPYVDGKIRPDYGEASHHVLPFYSRSKSFLNVNSLDTVLPCEGSQEVHVEYIISHSDMDDAKELSLHYLVVSKVSIRHSGTVDIKLDKTDEDIQGKVTLKLPLTAGSSKFLHVLVYTFLPNGEMLADRAKFNVLECFNNKVSAGFSPDEVLPGSDVSLQVEASPRSLCGLRVVDQSVVLMKPEKQLTADKVFNLFPSGDSEWYDYRIQEPEDNCFSGGFRPILPRPSIRRPIGPIRPIRPWLPRDEAADVYSFFKALRLKIVTSAVIKKPWIVPLEDTIRTRVVSGRLPEPEMETKESQSESESETESKSERVRAYFPETWIWELVSLGDYGIAEIHHKAPDTITDWTAGAVCMGPSGFGFLNPRPLEFSVAFFVDLTLPYSVVRGETFTLKASVFNYLKQCIKVRTTLQTTEELEEQPCDHCQYSSCICADESKTFYWNLKAAKLVFLSFQPGGVLVEKSHSSLICIKEGGQAKVEEISLKIPDNILEDSARAHITMLGDLMGTAMQNLDRLLAMPYGCGEQNMVLFAPNIFILQYLEKTHQLNSEIQSKAKKFLESGYQRQLTYKRDDGSYSAFGKRDKDGNTWLTGFVVKSFSKAGPYIFIDESHLNHSFSWLGNNQQDTGSFLSVGRLFNNAMKGGVEDETSLSAYITIALLEAGESLENPLLSNALSYLRKVSEDVSNVYTQSLLAFAFTLSGDTELRQNMLDKLDGKAVKGDGQLHWKRNSTAPSEDSYWYRAPSAEVELTSYVLLALLSGPNPDIGKASLIVNWLSKQQNPYGGFSSTQDTVVALQALAKYAEVTFSDTGDVTVKVSSKFGFHEQFHVDKNNRLLLQKASLSKIPGDYTVTATGAGCVFVQAPSLSVKPSSRKECVEDSVKKFEILITAAYTGKREKSNMAVIEIKMLSGYIPVKSTVRKLEKEKLIQRSDNPDDLVTLYLDQIDRNPVDLSFMVEQDVVVKDLKPATVKVYDYYETDDHATVDYNLPCGSDKSGNSR